MGDFLKYSSKSRLVLSHALEQTERLRSINGADSTARSIKRLTLAARLARSDRGLLTLQPKIRAKFDQWSINGFDWNSFFPGTAPRIVQQSIILKTPQPDGEKGVLFVSFEDNWLRLLRHANITRLARDYHLVISPTWSPPYDLPLLTLCKLWPTTFYTILSNFDDEGIFGRLSNKIIAVPLLASSWVNPDTFACYEASKLFDIVMLANFAQYKRHWVLFRAMAQARRKLTALLLGVSWAGRTKDTLEREASSFGVREQVRIMEALPDHQMVPALQSAKVSVIMSRGEGSCVAVAESLAANLPVGLVAGARVGSRAFINDQTGRFLSEEHLHEELVEFVDNYKAYEPRRWMLENRKCCWDSSNLMNDALKRCTGADGSPWTVDIKPMQWRPNPKFLTPEDAQSMELAYQRFARDYGVTIQTAT